MVECFEEEIIVYGFGRLAVGNLLAHGIRRVGNRKIPERNIRGGDIEIAVEIALDFLKALYSGQDRRMQGRQDFAGEQILLIRQYFGAGIHIIPQEGVNESTLSG